MIKEYKLSNDYLEVEILNLGATIKSIHYKNDDKNLVIGYKTNEEYLENSMFLGTVVGPIAGRIALGKIKVADQEYQLDKNNQTNNLHSGKYGISNKYFKVEEQDNKLIMTYTLLIEESYTNEEMTFTVIYELINNNLDMKIISNPTIETAINCTNHTYFNLNGQNTIENHELLLEANHVYELNELSLPQEKIKVINTIFDFNKYKSLSTCINHQCDQFQITKNIDHPFELCGDKKIFLKSDEYILSVKTNQDYVVTYLGNYLNEEEKQLNGQKAQAYMGICLETQQVPNNLKKVIINKGEEYINHTIYSFEKTN